VVRAVSARVGTVQEANVVRTTVPKSPGNLTSSGARSRRPGGISPGNPYVLLTAYYWLYEAVVKLLVAF